MISIKHKGDFSKAGKYLLRMKEAMRLKHLDRYGREGVAALAASTPIDTGLTSQSWSYRIVEKNGRTTISFHNSNIQNGVPIAIILQYGHATRNGGWVQGRDYINPAVQPVFDKIADEAWKEVTSL
jgi:hypothetical protein